MLGVWGRGLPEERLSGRGLEVMGTRRMAGVRGMMGVFRARV